MLSSFSIKLIYILLPFISCSIGFYNFIYFFTVGYGLSISLLSIGLMTMFVENLTFVSWIIGLTLILYGMRLSGYLIYKEITTPSYKKNLSQNIEQNQPMYLKLLIWICCAILYYLMVINYYYILANNKGMSFINIIGAIIQISGFILENIIDYQKSIAKKILPDRFGDTEIYKIIKCPNYSGEMILWLGFFISGLGNYNGFFEFILAFFGWIGMLFIMFCVFRRIEVKQNKNYGNLQEYPKYYEEIPFLLTLIPLYSVNKYNWLKG